MACVIEMWRYSNLANQTTQGKGGNMRIRLHLYKIWSDLGQIFVGWLECWVRVILHKLYKTLQHVLSCTCFVRGNLGQLAPTQAIRIDRFCSRGVGTKKGVEKTRSTWISSSSVNFNTWFRPSRTCFDASLRTNQTTRNSRRKIMLIRRLQSKITCINFDKYLILKIWFFKFLIITHYVRKALFDFIIWKAQELTTQFW